MNKENLNNLGEFLPILYDLNLDFSFLYLTKTGHSKSIMDATIHFRKFLKRNGIHDYEIQKQGNEHKIFYPRKFISHNTLSKESKASLYRPSTKNGDPRIWFYGLKEYCEPDSILGVVTDKKYLYVFNLSNNEIAESLKTKKFVYTVLQGISVEQNYILMELLNKLKIIHQKGFIPTVIKGDTGVGMTLESELGIPPNASKKADYKGIELKSSRKKFKTSNRSTLFTQVPDWKKSFYKSSKELLDNFGYWSDKQNRFNLNCTLKANTPNPQGLYLKVDEDTEKLYVCYKEENVVEWSFETLYRRLMEKQSEGFWVEAETKIINGIEHFQYNKVTYTKNPNFSLFPHLIDSGIITVDFIMHTKENGTARDHGYPFKIKKENLKLLFPEPKHYDLK